MSKFKVSLACPDRIEVELKTLILIEAGVLTEEYKPRLIMCKDTLEIRWEVDAQELRLAIPRLELTLDKHTTGSPKLLKLYFKPNNHYRRYFIDKLQLGNKRVLASMIAIPKKIGVYSPPWPVWVQGMVSNECEPSSQKSVSMYPKICTKESILTKDQLRKTVCGPRPLGGPSYTKKEEIQFTDSNIERSQQLTEPLDAEGSVAEENEQPAKRKEPPALDELLSGIQAFSDGIRTRLTRLAQREEAVETKKAKYENEVACKEEDLKRREQDLASEQKALKREQDKMASEKRSLEELQENLESEKLSIKLQQDMSEVVSKQRQGLVESKEETLRQWEIYLAQKQEIVEKAQADLEKRIRSRGREEETQESPFHSK